MALVVNTNLASITAQQHTASSRKDMETAMERLSSGLRINSAKDDAAGLAISSRLDSQIRGMSMAVRNANDAISIAQTAEGAQQEITAMLQRIRELAVQAASTSMNDTDRLNLNEEVSQLVAEIDSIAAETQFNKQNILNGGYNATVQLGPEASNTFDFSIASMRAASLGISGSGGSVSSNDLTGARINRTNIASIVTGDISINGQMVGSMAGLTATDDIGDVVKIINDSIDGVTASASNQWVAQNIGTGVTTAGQLVIFRTPNDSTTASASQVAATSFTIGATTSLEDMVSKINQAAGGFLTASINDDGKLTLANTTGERIGIADTSTAGAATGIGTAAAGVAEGNATFYEGFLTLSSDTGAPISIEKGFNSAGVGTDADLEVLGFRQTGKDNVAAMENVVIGKALTAAGVTGAWVAGQLKINGVDVYDATIATTTFQGKLDAINAKSASTGVTASAFTQVDITIPAATLAADTSVSAAINGANITTDGTPTMAELVTLINAEKDHTGVTAEAYGEVLRLSGAVSSINITDALLGATTGLNSSLPATTHYGSIRLESSDGSPIQIDTAATSVVDEHGFLNMNVGAADFDTNDSYLPSSGSLVSGMNVVSVAAAQATLTTVDNAIQQVTNSAASLGAVQNRLEHVVSNLSEGIVNTEASKSRIMDADFAVESARLAKQQVLQQASTAMLAQANASVQSVLTLLGG